MILDDKAPSDLYKKATTTSYPVRNGILTLGMKNGLLYMASIAYCLARLCIVALTLFSLRLMPESVYCATWVESFPDLQ